MKTTETGLPSQCVKKSTTYATPSLFRRCQKIPTCPNLDKGQSPDTQKTTSAPAPLTVWNPTGLLPWTSGTTTASQVKAAKHQSLGKAKELPLNETLEGSGLAMRTLSLYMEKEDETLQSSGQTTTEGMRRELGMLAGAERLTTNP